MAHQVSVFAENKPGRISRITEILAEAGVNIRAITISGSGEYGVIKLLVDDPDLACGKLSSANITANKREIIILLMEDRPGGLHKVTQILEKRGVNIEDAYGFVIEDKKEAALVIEVENVSEVEKTIKSEGIRILSDEEIYSI